MWDADFEQFVSVVKLEELPAKGKVELRRRLHTVAVPRNFHLLVVENAFVKTKRKMKIEGCSTIEQLEQRVRQELGLQDLISLVRASSCAPTQQSRAQPCASTDAMLVHSAPRRLLWRDDWCVPP